MDQPERLADLQRLELLRCGPESGACPPLLFVHGAFAGAWCWAEHFLPYFADRGYRCYAVSVRGHGASRGRDRITWHSVRDYVDDLAEAIERIGRAPIVIGHSMGGLIAQKYLERAPLPAVALLASVPPQGLLAASMGLALRKPDLLTELNGLLFHGRASLEAMRRAQFAGPVAVERLVRYAQLMQPESPRAVWDMTFFDLPQRWRMHLPPMLVLGADRDPLVPPEEVRLCAASYGVDAEIFPAMGHAMMLDAGWQQVAERINGWLHTLA